VGPIDRSVTHTRRVLYLRPYYALLLDTIYGTGTHKIDSHFNVAAPSVRIDENTQVAFSQNQGDVQIGLYPLERDHLKVSVIQGEHSAPDIKWEVPTVDFSKEQAVPAVFATFLYPYKGDTPNFSAEPLAVVGEGVWGQRIKTAKEEMEIALVKDGSTKSFSLETSFAGKVEIAAEGLVLRQPTGKRRVLIGGWGISSYASKDLRLTTDTPANLLVCLRAGHPAIMNAGSQMIHISLLKPFLQSIPLPALNSVLLDSNGVHPINDPSLFALPADTAPEKQTEENSAGQPL
jgi:hypothetical protein